FRWGIRRSLQWRSPARPDGYSGNHERPAVLRGRTVVSVPRSPKERRGFDPWPTIPPNGGFAPPNDTLAKLQTAPHTSGDAARPLPRLTFVWRERTATDVTPSQMSLPRRFSAGPKNRRFASFS